MARFQCYRSADNYVRWRLLGGNNRVLGVGVGEHPNYAAAARHINEVRQVVSQAEFLIGHAETGQWLWQLYGRRGPLARSGQGFARRVDAELAAGRFRAKAADAETDAALAIFSSGRRGRTVLDTDRRRAAPAQRRASDVWPQRPVG